MRTIDIFMRSLCLTQFALGLALMAEGRTFVVTDTNDSVKITSLRGAIIAANRSGGFNTIFLGQSRNPYQNQCRQWIYRLNIAGANEDAGLTGDLDITRGYLTIVAAIPNVTIDATGLGDRVFQVSSNAHLTLSHLTIQGGRAPEALPGSFYSPTLGAQRGGAICNAGVLVLNTCVITNNSSGDGNSNPGNAGGRPGGDGGGIYNSGTLSATDCHIAGNFSGTGVDGQQGGNGGGIKNDGICSLWNCVINWNQTGAGGIPEGNIFGYAGSGGHGGGINNSGKMVLNFCTISANTTGQGTDGGDPGWSTTSSPGGWGGNGGAGAGIYNSGQMQLSFSTIYANNSGNGGNGCSFGSGGNAGTGGNGAGIFNSGKLSLSTCTISDNLCGNGGSGGSGFAFDGAIGGEGGGGGGV